jgi:hypothetical protein
VRDWVPIEVHDLAVLSTGHARGLRLGGSRDLRLRRLSDQGARWFGIGKKVVSSALRAGSEARTTDNRTTIALGKLSLCANWLRDAGSY